MQGQETGSGTRSSDFISHIEKKIVQNGRSREKIFGHLQLKLFKNYLLFHNPRQQQSQSQNYAPYR
jgi:hypothetical protein